ncbi:Protein kinase domain [Dillenia turbinata]|uniref:Protein kinase domain n=1 Tax=Dillenia turbinata TaxID=194707 RepID=A0AAN8UIR2_9MAGN
MTCNSLIQGACDFSRWKVVKRFFKELVHMEILPNVVILNIVVDALCVKERLLIDGDCLIGQIDEAVQALHEILVDGCVFDAVTCNTLITGLLFYPYPPVMAVKAAEIYDSATLQKEKETLFNLQGSNILTCFGEEVVADNVQGPLSDIWAVGCFVLQMLTGKPPWSKKSEFLGQIDYEEKTHEIPNEISKEAKDFLKCCFVKNPMFRFTVEMLLNHSFVRDLGDDDGGHHDEDNSINDDCSRSLSLNGESLLYEGIGLFPEFLGDESGTKDAGFCKDKTGNNMLCFETALAQSTGGH